MNNLMSLSRLAILTSMFLTIFTASNLSAANDSIPQGMAQKAVNGFVNTATGFLELPVQTYKGFKNGASFIENDFFSKVVGTVLGFFRGGSHAIGRTASGAVELTGFWTANRESNEGIGVPLDANYSWEWGEHYSYFNPSLAEGVKPVFRKLGHGLSDNFLNILELPGQTILGFKEGTPVQGFAKGVLFSLSRGFVGITDIFTCIVPNPKETKGYAYKTTYPWTALVDAL